MIKEGGKNANLIRMSISRRTESIHLAILIRNYAGLHMTIKEPIAYRFQYNDGLKATMLLLNGLVNDFTFAAQLKAQPEPLSTLFYLPPIPNVVYSAALMSKAEETFLTRQAPYPVERTLLTSGLVEAGVRSLATAQRLETPHLKVSYQAPRASQFWRQ